MFSFRGATRQKYTDSRSCLLKRVRRQFSQHAHELFSLSPNARS